MTGAELQNASTALFSLAGVLLLSLIVAFVIAHRRDRRNDLQGEKRD